MSPATNPLSGMKRTKIIKDVFVTRNSLCACFPENVKFCVHCRLEVQADVTTNHSNKRASLSSESANFSLDAKSAYSLDAKSATVSFSDDASTKALAGSICNRLVGLDVHYN